MTDSQDSADDRRYGPTRRQFNGTLALALLLGGVLAPLGVLPAAPAAAQGAAKPLKIITLGDSLSAGYKLPKEAAFTSQLEAALKAKGYDVTVPNTGVSGETTTGGLARLDWLLADKPDLVIVELGANDGLRGIDPAVTRDNLDKILAKLQARGIPAVLAGMLAPRNMGPEYGRAFDALYPELARKYGVAFYPFFLDGVAMDPKLNLDDGMHPTAEGVAVIVKGILPVVAGVLDGLKSAAKAG